MAWIQWPEIADTCDHMYEGQRTRARASDGAGGGGGGDGGLRACVRETRLE